MGKGTSFENNLRSDIIDVTNEEIQPLKPTGSGNTLGEGCDLYFDDGVYRHLFELKKTGNDKKYIDGSEITDLLRLGAKFPTPQASDLSKTYLAVRFNRHMVDVAELKGLCIDDVRDTLPERFGLTAWFTDEDNLAIVSTNHDASKVDDWPGAKPSENRDAKHILDETAARSYPNI